MPRPAIIALLLVAVLANSELLACSCSRSTVDEAFKEYPSIFTGTVEKVDDQFTIMRKGWALLNRVFGRDPGEDDYESYYGYRITFSTTRVWKGRRAERISLLTGRGGGDCGIAFRVGDEYLVYASGEPLGAGLCSRTAPIAEAGDDLAYLRRAAIPRR